MQIFINYRSDDSSWVAGRLYSELSKVFWPNQVFLDYAAIQGGAIWPQRIRSALEASNAVVVLIGRQWLTTQDPETGNRRLSLPEDWVRLEIELALEKGIPLLPILIDEAKPLTKSALRTLPSISLLADIQALKLRTRDWDADFSQLTRELERLGIKRNEKEVSSHPGIPQASADFVHTLLEAAKTQVTHELVALRHKYVPGLYTPRIEIDQQISAFLASQAQTLLILGEAGAGKTNLVCSLARREGDIRPVFLLRAAAMGDKGVSPALVELLETAGGVRLGSMPFSKLPTYLNGERILLIIDAINEAPNIRAFSETLGATLQQAASASIQFCVTCRRSDWRFFRDDPRIIDSLWRPQSQIQPDERHGILLQRFDNRELDATWQQYSRYFEVSGELSTEARTICKHPLMLRFVCESFRKRALPPMLFTIDVFDQYWKTKVDQDPQRGAALFKIVLDLRKRGEAAIYEEALVSLISSDVYNALLSEEIILYIQNDRFTRARIVGFMYESFFEYCLARAILVTEGWERKTSATILNSFAALVNEANSNRLLVGVVEFVTLYFQEHDAFESLLDILANTAEWKQRCCTLFPKLSRFNRRFSKRLSQFISDEDYWVRWAAAFAAAQLPAEDDFDALMKDWFGSSLWQVREGAANAMAHRSSTSTSWPALAKFAADPFWRVRRAVANAINHLISRKVVDLEILMELAQDASWRRRDVAIIAQRDLNIAPERSQQLLSQLIFDSNERIRFSVAKFAGTIPSAQYMLPLLRQLSQDPSEWVRRTVAKSIVNFADEPDTLSILQQLSTDPIVSVRWQVARVVAILPENGSEADVILERLEKDLVSDVCIAADFSSRRRAGLLPLLLEQTLDQSSPHLFEIREALARVTDFIVPPRGTQSQAAVSAGWKADYYLGMVRAVHITFEKTKPEQVEELVELLLADMDEGLHWALVQALGSLPIKSALRCRLAAALLFDRHAWARQAMIEELATPLFQKCNSLASILIRMASDPDPEVRLALAVTAKRFANEALPIAEPLLALLRNDTQSEIREATGAK